jgi:hypothetical protein
MGVLSLCMGCSLLHLDLDVLYCVKECAGCVQLLAEGGHVVAHSKALGGCLSDTAGSCAGVGKGCCRQVKLCL